MTDLNFPIIKFNKNQTNFDWGKQHGEEFKDSIKELVKIRKELMKEKNPKLIGNKLDELANIQYEESKKFAPNIWDELEGIRTSANLSVSEIVILNNYTDFRDINLSNEGCSAVVIDERENLLMGQTWDMHGSAKNYVCLLHFPATQLNPEMILLSVTGCVGMMGYNQHRQGIAINNLTTQKARAGIIWPTLVRKTLSQKNLLEMEKTIVTANVTSGHSYLISSLEGSRIIETTPSEFDIVFKSDRGDLKRGFHTNHCLGNKVKKLESETALNSTTKNRFDLLTKKIDDVDTFSDFKKLLTDHDEFPKSICGHFQSSSIDPALTCGGAISDLVQGEFNFWRGCPLYDKNFKEYQYKLIKKENQFTFKQVEN